ncbi:hypothetical protein DXM29_05510 [Agrobacterium tumefaciens]|nr:hypothetical protein DXM29_05510 [Agrobacterium tumefaciens]
MEHAYYSQYGYVHKVEGPARELLERLIAGPVSITPYLYHVVHQLRVKYGIVVATRLTPKGNFYMLAASVDPVEQTHRAYGFVRHGHAFPTPIECGCPCAP